MVINVVLPYIPDYLVAWIAEFTSLPSIFWKKEMVMRVVSMFPHFAQLVTEAIDIVLIKIGDEYFATVGPPYVLLTTFLPSVIPTWRLCELTRLEQHRKSH